MPVPCEQGWGCCPLLPSPGHGPWQPPSISSALLIRNSSEKYSSVHVPMLPGRLALPGPSSTTVPHPGRAGAWAGWAGMGNTREGTVQGRLLAWGSSMVSLQSPPALTDAGMDVVGLGKGFGVGGQKRGYRGVWACSLSSMGNEDP